VRISAPVQEVVAVAVVAAEEVTRVVIEMPGSAASNPSSIA